ncbi:MAG: hypothetical protein HY921_10170 [Elusimicrobia bacterium]|nr:hypothetical protein [Elusimicrobiota bacterium]
MPAALASVFFAFPGFLHASMMPQEDAKGSLPSAATRPIRLPVELEAARGEVAGLVNQATTMVAEFAKSRGWAKEAEVSQFDSVEIFSSQDALWRRIVELDKFPADTKLPTDGLAAALESRILLAVAPREYKRLRPEYAAQKEAWVRLLAHELVHRLHVQILGGNDDAMGPGWFFEGFAVVGAGQSLKPAIKYTTAKEALDGAATKGRGAYARYAAAVRFFMSKVHLSELLKRAGQENFEDWLKTL